MKKNDLGKKIYLGEGLTSKCYKLSDNKVYKKFKRKRDIIELKKYRDFLEYKNDSVIFPYDFVYKRKFIGYIYDYSEGLTLSNCFKHINIDDLIFALEKVERDINYISKGKIFMYDVHDDNIIYGNKKLSIIDVDEYNIKDSLSISDALYSNNIQFKNLINGLIISNIPKELIERFIKYKDFNLSSYNLYKLKEDINDIYKEKIKTINDIWKVI